MIQNKNLRGQLRDEVLLEVGLEQSARTVPIGGRHRADEAVEQ